MVPECRHIKTSGGKCCSPALRGQSFCYFHARLKQRAVEPETALTLPNLEDRGAIQLALNEVVKAVAARKVNAKRAGILLYALQIASSNAKYKEEIVSTEAVDDVVRDEQGQEVAPEGFSSRPPEQKTLGMFLMEELEKRNKEEEELKQRDKRNQELSSDNPSQLPEYKDLLEK